MAFDQPVDREWRLFPPNLDITTGILASTLVATIGSDGGEGMPPILYEKRDRIVLVTINRPERRNALNFEAFGLLAKAWIDFRDDPDLWVAVITGAGDRAFCAGGDLKEFIPAVTQNVHELAASGGRENLGHEVPANAALIAVLRAVDIYKPIIAAVNGACIAGGMELLQGTDIRIASETATFAIGEPRRGLFPGGGSTVKLPRQIPLCHAMQVLLTAEPISARKAYEFGIVNEVVPAAELIPTAMRYAETICLNGPVAVRKVKEAVMKGLALPLPAALEKELEYAAEVFSTEDAMEGIRSFAEKRKPQWKGR
jgi:enoyl-CoA hydratase